ncbi:rhodanese-like domain-containing protein [Lysobacter capsici]|uniref:rhodanese-like domain-containing protein n=1 Tax=Lysobacter capsici TaxID=435897 RepID=UPI001C004E97|nr:rhodanese-like domain-containing protein [Lysobacter capsici]QWF14786.1 monothiol glutaredoxin, Grx4 family [Lysobacter capsici]
MNGTPATLRCGLSRGLLDLLDDMGLAYAHIDATGELQRGRGSERRREWLAIPQLYLDGEYLASGDLIEQMANAGKLHIALGLPAPDRRPPEVTLSAAAADFLRAAIGNSAPGTVAEIEVDAKWASCVRLVPRRKGMIQTQVDGVPLQFGLSSARRSDGLSIDWEDVDRGPSWTMRFPGAPVIEPVRPIAPADADAAAREGRLLIVDIRHPQERALAQLSLPFLSLDESRHEIRNLAPAVPLAVLCHRGDRSVHAAEHLHRLGHRDVYYIEGGIQAWADLVDTTIARY